MPQCARYYVPDTMKISMRPRPQGLIKGLNELDKPYQHLSPDENSTKTGAVSGMMSVKYNGQIPHSRNTGGKAEAAGESH